MIGIRIRTNIAIGLFIFSVILTACNRGPDLQEPKMEEIAAWLETLGPVERSSWMRTKYESPENRRALFVLLNDIDSSIVSKEIQLLLIETIRTIGMDQDIELVNIASVASGNLTKDVRGSALMVLEEIDFEPFSGEARLDASRMIENRYHLGVKLSEGENVLHRRMAVVRRLRDLGGTATEPIPDQ